MNRLALSLVVVVSLAAVGFLWPFPVRAGPPAVEHQRWQLTSVSFPTWASTSPGSAPTQVETRTLALFDTATGDTYLLNSTSDNEKLLRFWVPVRRMSPQ